MFGQRVDPQTRPKYERGTVNCPKCRKPIYVYKLKALADEFSAQCKSCGNRGLFSNRDVTIELLPDRRKKPRKS